MPSYAYVVRITLTPCSARLYDCAPGSLPPKHSAAGMRATPPALFPSETLCCRWASKAPDSLLSKHSAPNVRAMPPALSLRNSPPPTCVQRPQLLSALSTLLPMWARAGGGRSGHSVGGRRLEQQPQREGRAQEEEQTDGGRRTERLETNVGGIVAYSKRRSCRQQFSPILEGK
jgi:hypothetical protein